MLEIMKIAWKNAQKNKRKSIFVFIAVLFSILILLISSALTNGMVKTINYNYLQVQSGHIVAMWKAHYNLSPFLPGKFLNPNTSKSFNYEEDEKNIAAAKILDDFLEKNSDKVDFAAKIIRRSVSYSVGSNSYATILYGVTKEDADNLNKSKAVNLVDGKWPAKLGEIMISEDRLQKGNLKLGDSIKIESFDISNKPVSQSYTIVGVYGDGAEYNGYFGFMTDQSAKKLFNMRDDMYDMVKIYLKDINDSKELSKELDKALLVKSDVLRAQDWYDAGLFFTSLSPTCKIIYQWFVVILLLIISVGLKAIIRLNIVSSMKEFGIMRAIGFSKRKCFGIVFLELFYICCTAAVVAIGVALVIVNVVASNGIYIGPSVMTNAFGGEYLYLILNASDYLFASVVIIVFSILCTLGPALKLCRQKIISLLRKVAVV